MLLSLSALFSVYCDLCFLCLPQQQSFFSSWTQHSVKLHWILNITSDHLWHVYVASVVDRRSPPPPPPKNFLSPHWDMPPNAPKKIILRKHCPCHIQCWLCINCGRAFVWEMNYPLPSSNSSGGGNCLFIKIKIKCHCSGWDDAMI